MLNIEHKIQDHSQNLQYFLRQTLSLRKHYNSWPRSLKSTFVRRVFMLINLSLSVRKPAFCICENKDADQLRSNCVFTTRIVQSLYFLYTKLQVSGHLLSLYSLVCVGPSRKPLRPVFSQRGSFRNFTTGFFLHYVLLFVKQLLKSMIEDVFIQYHTIVHAV